MNVDSGATDTMIVNKDNLSLYKSIHHPINTAGDHHQIFATNIGTLTNTTLPLTDVLAVPTLTKNLLSVAKVTDSGHDVISTANTVIIGKADVTETIATGQREGNSYYMNFELPSTMSTAYMTSPSMEATQDDLQNWHLKFNHMNAKDILKLDNHNMVTGLHVKGSRHTQLHCEACLVGKGKKCTKPKQSLHKATKPFENVWFDVVVVNTPGFSNERYALILLDDYSNYARSFCLKSRSEVAQRLIEYDQVVYNQKGHHIHYLRSDNAPEHKTNIITSYCKASGIVQQFTINYNSTQNKEERFNYTAFNAVRTMLAQ
jgi:hypothetical protein